MSKKSNKKYKNYKISPKAWALNDEKTVAYHLKKSDYFGTMATIASLLSHLLKDKETISKKEQADIVSALNNIEKDSIFLQENYKIVPKSDPKQKTEI